MAIMRLLNTQVTARTLACVVDIVGDRDQHEQDSDQQGGWQISTFLKLHLVSN